jgi:hypothetical protein
MGSQTRTSGPNNLSLHKSDAHGAEVEVEALPSWSQFPHGRSSGLAVVKCIPPLPVPVASTL